MAFRNPNSEGSGCFMAWFALCAVLAIGVVGVVVWAIISLVNHVTG